MNVIIPTYNRTSMMFELLRSLAHQTMPARIIIVDDGSALTPNPFSWPNVIKYLWARHDGFGIAARLNEGIAACHDETAAIIADDCLPLAPTWLEEMSQALCSAPFAMGQIQYAEGAAPLHLGFTLANFAFDVGAMRYVGGLDEAYCGGYGYEEADLGMRIAKWGLKIALPAAPVRHLGGPYAGGDRGPAVLGRNKAIFEAKWGYVDDLP